MVRANNPSLLKEYGGDLVLTDKWVRGVLGKNTWSKHKGTTGRIDPSHQFLANEKFNFQRIISGLVPGQDIPPSLIINIDQTPQLNVNTGKYTFSFKGAKNIPIKGDFANSGKTERSLPKYSFPPSFSVMFTENHWSSTEKCVVFFKEIIFP